MSNAYGPINLTTTGTGKTFNGFGFQPNELEFEVGAKNGASATFTHCQGGVDSAGTQYALVDYNDYSGNHTHNVSTADCILIREYVSGNWVDVLKGRFEEYTSDGFKLNVLAANSNYQVFVKARN